MGTGQPLVAGRLHDETDVFDPGEADGGQSSEPVLPGTAPTFPEDPENSGAVPLSSWKITH
jgi:hypothetical protein